MNAPSFCTKSFWKPGAIWSTLSMTLRARFWRGNFHSGDGSLFPSRSLQSISWHLSAIAERQLCPLWSGPSVPQDMVHSACVSSPWSKGTSLWSSPQQAKHPQPPQLTRQKSEAVMSMCLTAALWSQDQTWSSVIWRAPKGHICLVEQNTTGRVLPSTAGAEGWQMSFLISSGFEESLKIHRQHSNRINIKHHSICPLWLCARLLCCGITGIKLGWLCHALQGAPGKGRYHGVAELTVYCFGALTNPPHLRKDGTEHGGRFILLQFSFWIQQGLTLWRQS